MCIVLGHFVDNNVIDMRTASNVLQSPETGRITPIGRRRFARVGNVKKSLKCVRHVSMEWIQLAGDRDW